MRALTSHAPILAVAACSYKKASAFPTTWHSVCRRGADNAAASRSLSMEARRVAAMFAAMVISLRSPGCAVGVQGTASQRQA